MLLPLYERPSLTIHSGEGCYVTDTTGRRYLDFIAGIGVNALGHAHPRIVRAIANQAALCLHTSNLYSHEYQAPLDHRLCQWSGLSHAFFSNSGTEAMEAALKAALAHGTRQHPANHLPALQAAVTEPSSAKPAASPPPPTPSSSPTKPNADSAAPATTSPTSASPTSFPTSPSPPNRSPPASPSAQPFSTTPRPEPSPKASTAPPSAADPSPAASPSKSSTLSKICSHTSVRQAITCTSGFPPSPKPAAPV